MGCKVLLFQSGGKLAHHSWCAGSRFQGACKLHRTFHRMHSWYICGLVRVFRGLSFSILLFSSFHPFQLRQERQGVREVTQGHTHTVACDPQFAILEALEGFFNVCMRDTQFPQDDFKHSRGFLLYKRDVFFRRKAVAGGGISSGV